MLKYFQLIIKRTNFVADHVNLRISRVVIESNDDVSNNCTSRVDDATEDQITSSPLLVETTSLKLSLTDPGE